MTRVPDSAGSRTRRFADYRRRAARLHRDGGGLDRDPPPHPAGVGATMFRLHASETLRAVNGPAMGQGGHLLRSWNECG